MDVLQHLQIGHKLVVSVAMKGQVKWHLIVFRNFDLFVSNLLRRIYFLIVCKYAGLQADGNQ
jgi:hypothetical protein